MDKISLFKSVYIFSNLENSLISQFVDQIKEVKISRDTEIFREGDMSDCFYIIDSGEINIYKQLGAGKEKILAILGPGTVFGEMAFFSDLPRTANARARTDSSILKINRDDFLNIVNIKPKEGLKILSRLLEVVMGRLEQTSRELATVYQTGKIISSNKPLNQIIKEVQDEILSAIPDANQYATFLYNEFNQEFEAISSCDKIKEIPVKNKIIENIKNARSGIISKNSKDDNIASDMFFKDSKSCLIVPILRIDNLLGFLLLSNSERTNAFKNSHALLLLAVAGQLSEAIENIHFKQEERDRQKLQAAKQEY
ncbi:MAG: cyclic nucleotide-binding domain-containing protein [Endomicrobiales bacterium]|nr:cyclic nucleotide-binding domain-containing protein [Endomicrobiales bacterium]